MLSLKRVSALMLLHSASKAYCILFRKKAQVPYSLRNDEIGVSPYSTPPINPGVFRRANVGCRVSNATTKPLPLPPYRPHICRLRLFSQRQKTANSSGTVSHFWV